MKDKEKKSDQEGWMLETQEHPEGKPAVPDAVYTVEELAAAHEKQFGCSYELVMAALAQAGKTEATLEEASRLVNEFRKREVR